MANRTVSVELTLKAQQYKAEAIDSRLETERLDQKVEALNRDLDKIPIIAAKAGGGLAALGAEAELTGRKLDDGRSKVKQFVDDVEGAKNKLDDPNSQSFLRRMFGLTGIPQLASAIGQRFSELGLQAGDAFGKGFKGFLDAMPGELKLILGGLIATAVVGSLSFIGAAVNGLLLSGVGLGGIGALVAGQLHSPQVVGAVQQLGHDLMNQLGAIGTPFAGNTALGIGAIGAGASGLLASLTPSLQKLAQVIDPLASGIGRMLTALGPGLSKALDASAPILRTLAAQLPGLGRAFSDFFASLAGGGKGATEGLIYLLRGLEGAIRTTGQTIELLSKIFQGFIAFADAGTGAIKTFLDWMGKIPGIGWLIDNTLGKVVDKNHKMFHGIHDGAGDAKDGLDGIAGAAVNTAGAMERLNPQLGQAATQAQAAATAFQNLSKGLDAAFNRTMNVNDATLQWQQSLLALTDSVKQNGLSLDGTTKQGNANLQTIDQSIKSINQLRDANIANGDSIDTANGKYEDQLNQLQKTLIGLGYNKDAVQALIDKYRAIPGQVSTTVNVLGLDSSIYKLGSVTQTLNDLNGKITTTYLVVDTQTGQTQKIVHQQGYNRWGGIYEHAETGLLNAGIYSTASPARYAFAEPATGGEAFVPRFGDYGRSTAILDQAARWYGGRFMAGGMAGGGAVRVEMAFTGAAAGSLGSVIMGMVRTGDIQIKTSQLVSG